MTVCLTMLLRPGTGALRQIADDEAASGFPERFAFRQVQTARRRLAMTRQAVVRPPSLIIAQPFMAGLNVINIKSSPAGTKEIQSNISAL